MEKAVPLQSQSRRKEAKDNIKIGKFFESLKASIRKSGRFGREAGAPVRKRDRKNTQRAL